MIENPTIKLQETEIPVFDQSKFFGVLFDIKLLLKTLHRTSQTKCTRVQKSLMNG